MFQRTIGDGNCGPRAICDQLNMSWHQEESLFGPEDYKEFRAQMMFALRQQLRDKRLSRDIVDNFSPDYVAKMREDGKYVDHIFMQVVANFCSSDIIIIPIFPENGAVEGETNYQFK